MLPHGYIAPRTSEAMSVGDDRHGTQQDFELYSMGRLAEPRLTPFEEHLLICPRCQDSVDEEDRCRESIRGAARIWQQQQSSPARRVLPRLAWAYAAAL